MTTTKLAMLDRHHAGMDVRARVLPELSAVVPFELGRMRLARRTLHLSPPRVTLVRAPAGYGKTVLLRQWAEDALAQGQPVIWVDLKGERCSARHLMARLAAGLRRGGFDTQADLLQRIGPSHSDLSLRVAELATSLRPDAPLLMLIDHIDGASDAGGCLQALLDGAGAGMHFALAGRGATGLSLGRLYVNGLCELGPGELRFTPREIDELIEAGRGEMPLGGELRALFEHTEGWPAAVHLIVSTLCEGTRLASAADILPCIRFRLEKFFVEDVLAQQPVALRRFLPGVCILDSPCAELCDAVTGAKDSQALLEECEHRGLFVRCVDAGQTRFRCHPLLLDHLRSQLGHGCAEEQRLLHERASRWFDSAGDYGQAFDHAIAAGQPVQAARILEGYCADRRSEGLGRRLLLGMVERLPQELRNHHPHILLAMAWTLIFWWDFDQAQEVLIACRNRLNQLQAEGSEPAERLQELEHLYLHRQMTLALFQDDLPRVIDLCDRLIRQYVLASPLVKASFFMSMIQAQTDRYRLRDADVLATRARKALERSSHPLPFVPLISAMARVRLMGGLDGETISALTDQLALAEHHSSVDAAAAAAMLAIPLAEIHYERNELDQAAALLRRHLPTSPGYSFLDCWISGRLLRSRLLRSQGDLPGSLAALDVEPAWAPAGGLERLRQFFAAERIGLLLRLGRGAEALRHGREVGADGAIREVLPADGGASTCKEVRALSFVRLAQVQGRTAEALRVCAHWRGLLASAGAVRSLVRWEALTAALLLVEGQSRPAQRHLRQAIIAAAPGRYLRSIIDEGQQIGELLLDNPHLAVGPGAEAGDHRFGHELIAAFERELNRAAAVPAGPVVASEQRVRLPVAVLNPREVEMLRMIAAGLRNRELAKHLAMTEGTVKWYVHHIYEKLGVNRRTLAIKRSRELGLL